MTDYRIPNNDLCMSEAMPFSQRWEARIPEHSIDDLDIGKALINSRSMLRAGDEVTVTAFASKAWARLTEVAVFRVVETGEGVQVVQIGETFKVPAPKPKAAPVPEPLFVKKVFGGGFAVRDKAGNVIEQFATKAEAEAFAKANGGLADGEGPGDVGPAEAQKRLATSHFEPLKVVAEQGGGFTAQNAKGNVIERFKTRAEADAYIAHENGKAPPKAA